jgi:uncharacterized low-complexity protein
MTFQNPMENKNMIENKNVKPMAVALGSAVTATLATVSTAQADANPFGMTQLSEGYMVADSHEGKCGGMKEKEGKCGEGKCGAKDKKMEGKCGEGKCGGAKDKKMEGKCGEGKCGGNK